MNDLIIQKTILSTDRQHRYTLWRGQPDILQTNCDLEYINFIGLNPSTADEDADDATIRRLIGFTRSWGYHTFCVTNLFAYRATQPSEMMSCSDPVGSQNDEWIIKIAARAKLIVVMWGCCGTFLDRDDHVAGLLHPRPLFCFKTTLTGAPAHPVRLSGKLKPIPYIHVP